MEKNQLEQEVISYLKDSGCDSQMINEFIKCLGDEAKQNILLKRQKCFLLNKLHEYQKRIDCLDYFIYKMKEKGEKSI